MNTAELIKALRNCGNGIDCKGCPYLVSFADGEHCFRGKIANDAADALEAAEKRIARLEEDLKTREAEREVMQDTIKVCEKRIAELEAVDVVPVVHGEWIETEMGYDDYAWVCTVCGEPWVLNAGTPSENDMNYCPNCNAKMDGGDDDE